MSKRPRVIFVGGGLANSLAAYRLGVSRPDLDWVLLEQHSTLGGDHTWSCHRSDLPPECFSWLHPFITKEWDRHEVRFPNLSRVFDSPYLSIRSQAFDRFLRPVFGERASFGAEVSHLEPHSVTLKSGEVIEGSLVIDGRGLRPESPPKGVGFQKFRGLFVESPAPHGIDHPIIMDATISQEGGYRFFYVLPWSDRELLVEDTYYDQSTGLPGPDKDPGIMDYLGALGVEGARVTGVENGILPIPLFGAERPNNISPVMTSGLAAGLFHPTTGYSLPDAVRFAEWLAKCPEFTHEALFKASEVRAKGHWRRGQFYRRLNNMLFHAALPAERYKILATFHEHDPALIARFYAFELKAFDRLRILRRKPEIHFMAALRAFFTRVAHDT